MTHLLGPMFPQCLASRTVWLLMDLFITIEQVSSVRFNPSPTGRQVLAPDSPLNHVVGPLATSLP